MTFAPAALSYAVFFVGQCLWVLVCAAAAIRSQHNPIKTRRAYLVLNWDILLVRFVLEIGFFTLWTRFSMNDLLKMTGQAWTFPFSGNGGLTAILMVGFASDSLLGAVSHWDRLPGFARTWIAERIPQLPEQDPVSTKSQPNSKGES